VNAKTREWNYTRELIKE